MKVVQINALSFGSTGKIMLNIADMAQKKGIDMYTFSSSRESKGNPNKNHFYIDKYIDYRTHYILSVLSGYEMRYSYFATRKLIKKLKKISPDIIHLHITHGWYLNHKLLFDYIRQSNKKLIWTFHDCWPFTGRCPHFQITGCDKWKTGCHNCSYDKTLYPASYVFDRSKKQFELKKKWFLGIENMTIVTPSQWLADLVKESFFKDYPVKVINNGIDLTIFKPTESDFREKYNLNDKYVLLGVAFGWGMRKGLDVFIELAKRLDDKYRIVLVGTDENTDKLLPKNIISIHRTNNQTELAEIYSAADLFVNPTREENYPTVNMEAVACGTPVVAFRTGGSPEMLDETCGSVVPCDDVDAMESEIVRICESGAYSEADCLKKAKSFDMNDRFCEYAKLYNEIGEKL